MAQKILVVEDESAIADTIQYALATEGFDVTVVGTGSAAREALAAAQFELAVLDVGLPDCNGFDLFRELRRSSELPVVFLTARSEEVDRIVGLEIGADDYMAKPFSPRELTARVRAILRRCASAKDPEPEVAESAPGFSHCESACEIRYHGELLRLSRGEYRLLTAMLSRPGWVLSREQLLDLAWDDPMASEPRTVDTHIKTIRAKLRKITPDQCPIITHHSMGYSLSVDP
ncbi:MAG TPA: two-component system response regulator CreB [Lentisphaeria bacterium]|nr:two-component system response regulator CreB [Lentisphaeria bacterium]